MGYKLKRIMMRPNGVEKQVRPVVNALCFTANEANSTVKLNKNGSPTAVTLETSTDLTNWSTYTFGNTITLSNVGDKVYWRNTSETDTRLNLGNYSNCYMFSMTGSIAGSGDITYLLNKNGTNKLSDYCFSCLFYSCYCLITFPELPNVTLAPRCYLATFFGCSNLETLPRLYATTLPAGCYQGMFNGCYYGIKLSTTQTGEYQTPYRIPVEGTGTDGGASVTNMFSDTGGTFKGTPSLNTTYYTSSTVV